MPHKYYTDAMPKRKRHPRAVPKSQRATPFVGVNVWPTTRNILRDLARLRRQSLALVVDDVLRAAYAAEALVTTDEDQPGYTIEHHK